MATSIGQYAPVFLPGEPFSLTEKTVYRVAKSWTLAKQPCAPRHKTFFACGSSAPVRVECEGDTASWPAGTLTTPCAWTRTASTAGVMALAESFFEPLVAGDQKAFLVSLFP